jgi:hypothetical protein
MPIMKAVVIHEPGGPEVLKVESIPIPTPLAGQVLIRVKAFAINRSEMYRSPSGANSAFSVTSCPSPNARALPGQRKTWAAPTLVLSRHL